jgi:hypothetical protein
MSNPRKPDSATANALLQRTMTLQQETAAAVLRQYNRQQQQQQQQQQQHRPMNFQRHHQGAINRVTSPWNLESWLETRTQNVRAATAAAVRNTQSTAIIPIGTFRDPQGNEWKASLYNPSPSAMETLCTSLEDSEVRPLIIPQPKLRSFKRSVGKLQESEIIDLQSDDTDNEQDGGSKPNDSNSIKYDIQRANALNLSKQDSKFRKFVPLKSKQPVLEVDMGEPQHSREKESRGFKRFGFKEQMKLKPESHLHFDSGHPMRTDAPPVAKKSKTENSWKQIFNDVTVHQRPIGIMQEIKQSLSTGEVSVDYDLYGPFVQQYLDVYGNIKVELSSPLLLDLEIKEYANKFLLAATGYSTETAPSNLPFPPSEINLAEDQIDELCQELHYLKAKAVASAVLTTYSDCKARHDVIQQLDQKNIEFVKTYVQKVTTLKGQYDKMMAEEAILHAREVHTMKQDILALERRLQSSKDEVKLARNIQAKSLNTILQTSALAWKKIHSGEATSISATTAPAST